MQIRRGQGDGVDQLGKLQILLDVLNLRRHLVLGTVNGDVSHAKQRCHCRMRSVRFVCQPGARRGEEPRDTLELCARFWLKSAIATL